MVEYPEVRATLIESLNALAERVWKLEDAQDGIAFFDLVNDLDHLTERHTGDFNDLFRSQAEADAAYMFHDTLDWVFKDLRTQPSMDEVVAHPGWEGVREAARAARRTLLS